MLAFILADKRKTGIKDLQRYRTLIGNGQVRLRRTFYSVFNLIEACLGRRQTSFGDLTVYVSINQAADALETSKGLTFEEITEILYNTKNGW
jgi:hypothetical protein